MSAVSTIEWTDATWNPVRGCTRVSAGCGGPNRQGGCYAEQIAARFSGPGQPFEGFAERGPHGGRWTGKMALVDEALTLPLRWKKPRRIFVNSMSDLFHENLPDEAIDKVFAVMALAPRHTFQVLTKRAKRMREYFGGPSGTTSPTGFRCPRLNHILNVADRLSRHDHPAAFNDLYGRARQIVMNGFLPNVWLGVSTEDQATADERIPHLLATPAAKRFISAEPLLGAISFRWTKWDDWESPIKGVERQGITDELDGLRMLDWVIAGGESGPRARTAHPDWFRALRDQCAAAGVPFFVKQWGEWLPVGQHLPGHGKIHGGSAVKPGRMKLHYGGTAQTEPALAFAESGVPFAGLDDGRITFRVGKKAAGADLDGRMHREFPT